MTDHLEPICGFSQIKIFSFRAGIMGQDLPPNLLGTEENIYFIYIYGFIIILHSYNVGIRVYVYFKIKIFIFRVLKFT